MSSNSTAPFLTPDDLSQVLRLSSDSMQLTVLRRPVAIGTWVASILFTVELIAVIQYFRSDARRRDSFFIKLGVLTNLFADLVGIAACCATAYLYSILYWGNTEALERQYWPLTVVVFTIGVVTAVSQFFMITSYWQMTKHHYVFAILFLVLLAAVTGIFGCGILMVLSQTAESMVMNAFIYLALVSSAVGNVFVGLPLFWQLCKRNAQSFTKWNFPKMVVLLLFEAGALTTAVTLAGAATWFAARDTKIWIALAFVQPRIYSCTMLYALHARPESDSSIHGNAVEKAQTMKEIPGEEVPVEPKKSVSVMEDADAFRLTRRKIELAGSEFGSDSGSDVSRKLNDELLEIENGSRRSSIDSRFEEEMPPRSDSPSEYGSPSPDGRRSPWPMPPRPASPMTRSVSAHAAYAA
ncbi:hypothetical protein FB45DRAFT_1037371 [Roridomyces roridus]|uniref:DUF6534 domain-containing protein n=1 Tax=Roridomyces roridus TaxID=1738132 RepID=A0AAD7FA69_9AGAR|nr:hypothetical protein FB45DRAFT_1037371 [Roridomyces roridus]